MGGAASSGNARPTVLLVGRGEPMDDALAAAMETHGLDIERAATDQVAQVARAAAPDLALLVGDAAEDGGAKVLAQLATSAVTQVIPVALLSGDAALDARVRAFRHGVVAVIERTASADEVARRVASLARELPERAGEASGELGEATLDELLALVKRELKTGILSVQAPAGVTEGSGAYRLVLGAGKPVARAVEDFVQQLRPLVSKAEPLRWELLESASSRLANLDSDGARDEGDVAILDGLRVLLVVLDPVRADALATELRTRGATVGVTDASGRGLDRARSLDPEVVVLDSAGLEGRGFEVVRAIRRDPRLRWSSMLVAHWEELWPEGASAPDIKRIAGRIAPLVEPDRSLAERARGEATFDTRLELVGPSRLLRAITRGEHTLHVTVRNPRAVVEVDLAQGLVVGAQAHREGVSGPDLEGSVALAALLALASGRVRIERRDRPSVANIMSPVEEALAAAASEAPPLPASMPPPSLLGALGGGPGMGPPSEPPVPRAPRLPKEEAEAPTGTVRQAHVVAVRDGATARSAGDMSWDKGVAPSPPEARVVEAFEEAPTRTHDRPGGRPAPRRRASMRNMTALGIGAPTRPPQVEPPVADPVAPAPAHVAHATVPPAAAATPAPVAIPHPPAHPPVRPPPAPRLAPRAPAAPAGASATSTGPVAASAPTAAPEPTPIASLLATPSLAPPAGHAHEASRPVTLSVGTATPSLPLPALSADGFVIPEAGALAEPSPVAVADEEPLVLPQRRSLVPLVAVLGAAALLLVVVVVGLTVVVPRLLGSHVTTPPGGGTGTGTGGGTGTAPVVVDAGTISLPPPVAPDLGAPVIPTTNPFVAAHPQPIDSGAVANPLVAVHPQPVDAGAPIVVAVAVEPDAGAVEVVDDGPDEGDDGPARPANVEAANFLTIRAARLVTDGNLRDAEMLYLRALRDDSHNPHALAGLAQLHLRRRAGRDALHYAEAAVAARPRRSAYRVILGDALALSGKRGEANAQYQEALRLDSHNHDARQRLHGR